MTTQDDETTPDNETTQDDGTTPDEETTQTKTRDDTR